MDRYHVEADSDPDPTPSFTPGGKKEKIRFFYIYSSASLHGCVFFDIVIGHNFQIMETQFVLPLQFIVLDPAAI